MNILQDLGEGVGVVRVRDRRILQANRAFAEVHRYRVDEVVGRTIDEFLVLEGITPAEHMIRVSEELLKKGRLIIEVPARRRGGEEFWAALHIRQVKDSHGDEVWIVELKDITSRKQLESQLKLHSEILAHTPDFFSTADAVTGRIEYMNCAGRKMTGLGFDADLSQLNLFDFISPGSVELVESEVIPTAIRDGVWMGELTLRDRNQSDIPVISVVQSHRDDRGNVRYLSNISRSILSRARQQAALAASVTELEDFYNKAPCGYHALDQNGIVQRMNDLELHWLGYRRDEVVGKMHASWFLSDDSFAEFQERFPRLQAGEDIRDLEVTFRRKDGSTFPVLLSAAAAREGSGRFLQTRTISVDLSNLKRTEQERELANQQFHHAARLTTLGEMAAGMAHEINQPLAHIALSLEVLRKILDEKSNQRDQALAIADEMDGSISRASRIISRVQAFGRKRELDLRLIDLNQTLLSALEFMTKQLQLDGIELVYDLSSELPPILSDPHQLEQVWINQISNARDALLEKPLARRLHVRTVRNGGWLTVEFEDNGVGMSPETKQKLFLPFYTTKPPGRGTGLGLSISLSIMQSLGGTISVRSELGIGTCFTFKLPIPEGRT